MKNVIGSILVFSVMWAGVFGVVPANAEIVVISSDPTAVKAKTFRFVWDGQSVTPTGVALVQRGSLTAAQAGDQFSWTVTGATGWSSYLAANSLDDFNACAAKLTFGEDVQGHGEGEIGGVVGGAAADQIDAGEVLIMDFDVSGLQEGSVLELISAWRGRIGRGTDNVSAFDWVLVDTTENTVIRSFFNGKSGSIDFGSINIVNSHYRLYIAANVGSTGNFRVDSLTIDVVAPIILGSVYPAGRPSGLSGEMGFL